MNNTSTPFSFNTLFESPTAEELVMLRDQIGWGELNLSMAKSSLENSLFHVIIRDDLQLIGMARIIGDGVMYFYIQDVIVHPNYQGQGVGATLMTQIEKYLSKTAKKGATVGLLSAKNKEGFYQQYGYTLRPNDALGNGMCKFI